MIKFTKIFATFQFIVIASLTLVILIEPSFTCPAWAMFGMVFFSALAMCLLSMVSLIAEQVKFMSGEE